MLYNQGLLIRKNYVRDYISKRSFVNQTYRIHQDNRQKRDQVVISNARNSAIWHHLANWVNIGASARRIIPNLSPIGTKLRMCQLPGTTLFSINKMTCLPEDYREVISELIQPKPSPTKLYLSPTKTFTRRNRQTDRQKQTTHEMQVNIAGLSTHSSTALSFYFNQENPMYWFSRRLTEN